MTREPKGFFVKLPTRELYSNIEKGISFQLKPEGVRYFFVESGNVPLVGARKNGKNQVRDISTQYRSLDRWAVGRMWLGEEETKKAHERLIAHACEFYPDFLIPDQRKDPYSWVAFPMIGAAIKNSGLGAPNAINLQIASGLRAFTVKDMTAAIFGESPKQLQGAVAESLTRGKTMVNIDNLTLASLLRGFLPPNALVEVLQLQLPNEGIVQQMDKHSANSVRMLLRRFNPQRLMRLVRSFGENGNSDMLLRDAANQYADARRNHPNTVMDLSRQFRSIDELHESVIREYRKLAYANEEIRYSDERTEKLKSIELPGGATLVWPNWTHDLMEWASDSMMNNCIYGFGNDAVAGRCLLLAVVDSAGKMFINIMIRGGNVTQCYGKANHTVTDEVLMEALFKGLIDADVINPENDHKEWLNRRGLW